MPTIMHQINYNGNMRKSSWKFRITSEREILLGFFEWILILLIKIYTFDVDNHFQKIGGNMRKLNLKFSKKWKIWNFRFLRNILEVLQIPTIMHQINYNFDVKNHSRKMDGNMRKLNLKIEKKMIFVFFSSLTLNTWSFMDIRSFSAK